MQLLYANDGINYRTISKSLALSTSVEKVLLETYLKYDFVSCSEAYSSIANEPEALTYVVSNLNNELSKNHLIVSKAGHMSTLTTPSYYFHTLIKDVDEDFFKEHFFEIFNYNFIKDHEINNYYQHSIDNYQFTSIPLNSVSLNDEQLITILATFMNNVKSNKKTKIIVDVKGDEYNHRSREILASIYHYLPYELRKRHGFVTYGKEGVNESGRVSFVLYALDELRNIDNTFIKLDAIDIAALTNTVDSKYLNYATYLVSSLGQKERLAHFENLSKLAKNGRLKIDDCVTYFSNLEKWQHGVQEKLLPEWIAYVDQNSFRKGPLYELMIEIIQAKVSNEYYNDYLFDKVLNLYNEKIDSLSSKAIKVIRFADYLDDICIDKIRFYQWYESQLKCKIRNLNYNEAKDIITYKKILETEVNSLEKVDIGSQQIKLLLIEIIKNINILLNKIEIKLTQFINEEAKQTITTFKNLQKLSLKEFYIKILSLKKEIIFIENTNILNSYLEKRLTDCLNKETLSQRELVEYEHFIDEIKNDLDSKVYQESKTLIQSKLNILLEERKARIFTITNKTDVLSSYKILQKYYFQGFLKTEDKIEVLFGMNRKKMLATELEMILEFVLFPTKISLVVKDNIEYLYALKLLSVQHFKYLLDIGDRHIKRVLDYYFKEFQPIEISGSYVAKELQIKAPENIKEIVELYKDDENEEVCLFVKQCKTKKKGLGGFFK
ncbi:MAG: hypothetical protein ACLR9T_01655 [Thomasclavelia sp.]|uniref:hypothetical protein n=1 Tax=Thomasclavelia sp. TaxID=3025757 RepID=UPI0039A12DB1